MSKLFGKKKDTVPEQKVPVTATAPYYPKDLLEIALYETKEQKKLMYYIQMYMQLELYNLENYMRMMASTQNYSALRVYARGIVKGRFYIAKIEENLIALNSFEDYIRSSQISFNIYKQLAYVGNLLFDVVSKIDDRQMRTQIAQFIKQSDKLSVFMEMQDDAMQALVTNTDEQDVDTLIAQQVDQLVSEIKVNTYKPTQQIQSAQYVTNFQ